MKENDIIFKKMTKKTFFSIFVLEKIDNAYISVCNYYAANRDFIYIGCF